MHVCFWVEILAHFWFVKLGNFTILKLTCAHTIHMGSSIIHASIVTGSGQEQGVKFLFFSYFFSRDIPIFPIYEHFLVKFPVFSYFPIYCCRTCYCDDVQIWKNCANLLFSLEFDEKTIAKIKSKWTWPSDWLSAHSDVFLLFRKSLYFGHATGDIATNKMFEPLAVDKLP